MCIVIMMLLRGLCKLSALTDAHVEASFLQDRYFGACLSFHVPCFLVGMLRQVRDQEMKGGNLALANCCAHSVPVRVVRRVLCDRAKGGEALRYDGLYSVTRHWWQPVRLLQLQLHVLLPLAARASSGRSCQRAPRFPHPPASRA